MTEVAAWVVLIVGGIVAARYRREIVEGVREFKEMLWAGPRR